ncbi:MAG TPA: DNA-binding response regulator, partial [Acidimicrobiia bacterium]
MTAASVRLLVVDDHPVVRQGLRTFLETRPDFEVVGEAGDG